MSYNSSTGGAAALAWAETKAGMPYQWGGTGNPSYDCSGLFQAAYRFVGVTLSRTTSDHQYNEAQVPLETPYKPGDGVFFRGDPSEASPGHVGLYVGFGIIMAGQHAWGEDPKGQDIFFDAPYTDDPFGIRYDYFEPNTVLFLTRPANLLTPGPPDSSTPSEGNDVDDQFISKNPTGPGDFLCSWSTRIAVGIPDQATEDILVAIGAKRQNLDVSTFAYFRRAVWSKP